MKGFTGSSYVAILLTKGLISWKHQQMRILEIEKLRNKPFNGWSENFSKPLIEKNPHIFKWAFYTTFRANF